MRKVKGKTGWAAVNIILRNVNFHRCRCLFMNARLMDFFGSDCIRINH